MTCSPPPQISRDLLKGPRRQGLFGGVHAGFHGLNLIFASLDKGGHIKVSILVQGFVRSLG